MILYVGTAFAVTFYTHTVSWCSMETNAVSKYKFLLLCMAFLGAMLASSHDARALSIGDSHELGFLWPGIQRKTDNQNKVTYVNHLIAMALGTAGVANGQVYSRSSHPFKSLPAAVRAFNGGGRTINLGSGGLYTYLFATYNAYRTEVWYVGNLSGITTIPFLAAGHYLTGWTLFGPRDRGSRGWPHGNVARRGSRRARFDATLPNALGGHA